MSEVKGSSLECQAVTAQERPRGATPHPRSGWRSGGANPLPKPGASPEARGGSREEQPPVQGLVAAWAQEGLEESSHVEGQEGWW